MDLKKVLKKIGIGIVYLTPFVGGIYAGYDLIKQYNKPKEERKKLKLAVDIGALIFPAVKVVGVTVYLITGTTTHAWNPLEYRIVQKRLNKTEIFQDSTKINKLEKTMHLEDNDSISVNPDSNYLKNF